MGERVNSREPLSIRLTLPPFIHVPPGHGDSRVVGGPLELTSYSGPEITGGVLR